MTDSHEMRMVNGKIRPVYTDDDGEYVIIDGEKTYIRTGLVCGKKVQHDHSGGQGHCWRQVDGVDLPPSIREEIEGEIIDGGLSECDGMQLSNGQWYRWS